MNLKYALPSRNVSFLCDLFEYRKGKVCMPSTLWSSTIEASMSRVRTL